MNQAEKRVFLIKRLLDEDRRYRGREVPADAYEQKRMLRSLINIRRPQAIDAKFLTVQDEYLRQEIEDTGITRLADLDPVCGDFISGRATSPGWSAAPLSTPQTAA